MKRAADRRPGEIDFGDHARFGPTGLNDFDSHEPVRVNASVIEKLVAGGQTGVDRAALDVALQLGIPIGGWCPKGRLSEDGLIPAKYPLAETATQDVAVRTELNVVQSDATLILTTGTPIDGTVLTKLCAEHHERPFLEIFLESPADPSQVHSWLQAHNIRVLNVAGPRESFRPGFIYRASHDILLALLRQEE